MTVDYNPIVFVYDGDILFILLGLYKYSLFLILFCCQLTYSRKKLGNYEIFCQPLATCRRLG
jgi:hypothetical protein